MLIERYYYISSAEGNLQEYVQDPKKPDIFHPFGNGIRRTPTKTRSYIEFLQSDIKIGLNYDMVESTKYKFT